MININSTQFVLAVPDLKRSVDFYVDKLGCELYGEPPGWAFLRRGPFNVMLGEYPAAIVPNDLGDHAYFAYVNVSDIDELYKELTAKSIKLNKQLTVEAWGMKEFAIETIDGHRIMFGEDV